MPQMVSEREWKKHKWVDRKRNNNGKWIYDYGNGFSSKSGAGGSGTRYQAQPASRISSTSSDNSPRYQAQPASRVANYSSTDAPINQMQPMSRVSNSTSNKLPRYQMQPMSKIISESSKSDNAQAKALIEQIQGSKISGFLKPRTYGHKEDKIEEVKPRTYGHKEDKIEEVKRPSNSHKVVLKSVYRDDHNTIKEKSAKERMYGRNSGSFSTTVTKKRR